jgi:hypothetical protein
MARKAAGKALAVPKAKAVRKAKAVEKPKTGLDAIDVEDFLAKLAWFREQVPLLASRRQAPRPPEEISTERRLSFLPPNEETIRTFELMALADGIQSFVDELTESIAEAWDKVTAAILNVYYFAEEAINDPEQTLTDAQREHLTSFVELVRMKYRECFGEEVPPK